jgi:hypothetical protein
MKSFRGAIGILLAAFALSAFAQGQGRLSPDDQRQFDKYYTKWVNDTRRNDRDDIAKDVGRMQEIMSRNHIPANVPFDRVASTGDAYGMQDYRGRLSADEQREFDKHYTKWVNDTRKNDRDDIAKDVRHMQEIMARKNIPANVPFDRIASTGYPRNGSPVEAYPASGQWRGRLSPDDQRDFDRAYAEWVADTRTNDRENISKDAGHMQAIMARNDIPADVPFDHIASVGVYPDSGYGADRAWQGRLSVDEQRVFDKYYANWLEDTRKNDRDDIDQDVRHMQDIMARNGIPANIPFDRIASPDAALRH